MFDWVSKHLWRVFLLEITIKLTLISFAKLQAVRLQFQWKRTRPESKFDREHYCKSQLLQLLKRTNTHECFHKPEAYGKWTPPLAIQASRTKSFLESTQIQCCFNVDFYRWINVDKSTLNQRGYHVDRCRNVISTYVNVESTLSVCWVILLLNDLKKIVPTPRTWHIHNIHNLFSAFRISNLQ